MPLLAALPDMGWYPAGRTLLERHVDVLMISLLVLAEFPTAAAVRVLALQCLLAVLDLPYSVLHRHRRQVLQVLLRCVDDKKRIVRQQAVECRQAWSASA